MNLRFDCEMRRGAEELAIAWRLLNLEPHDVGLFNCIRTIMPDGSSRFSPDTVWVEYDPTLGLLVRKCALAVPLGLPLRDYAPPYCSRVAAGAAYEELVRLRLPVVEMQPLRRAVLLGLRPGRVVSDEPLTALRVTFGVGVFPITATSQLVPQQPALPAVLTTLSPERSIARQEIIERTFKLSEPIAVLGYRVVPWP